MRGKTIFYAALIGFLIVALMRVFDTDTSDPKIVAQRYLGHWQSGNDAGRYCLLSTKAKNELSRQDVNNIADYLAHVAKSGNDLVSFELLSNHVGQSSATFEVSLQFRDLIGKDLSERATFYLVQEKDGWRMDYYRRGSLYSLP